jgi:hypothetical protein
MQKTSLIALKPCGPKMIRYRLQRRNTNEICREEAVSKICIVVLISWTKIAL